MTCCVRHLWCVSHSKSVSTTTLYHHHNHRNCLLFYIYFLFLHTMNDHDTAPPQAVCPNSPGNLVRLWAVGFSGQGVHTHTHTCIPLICIVSEQLTNLRLVYM